MSNNPSGEKRGRFSILPLKPKDSDKHLSKEHHGLTKGGMPLLLEADRKRPGMELIRASRLPKVKRALVSRIVPTSLIPLATATGLLVLGSHKTTGPAGDCSFPLPTYLVWAGAISTSLAIIGIVGRYILEWIISDRVLTLGEKNILLVLEYVGLSLSVFQVVLIIVGAAIIFPELPHWQYRHRHLPNYCDYGMVVFSAVFFGLTLLIVTVTSVFGLIIVFCDTEKRHWTKKALV